MTIMDRFRGHVSERNPNAPKRITYQTENHPEIDEFIDELREGLVTEDDPRWGHIRKCDVCGPRVSDLNACLDWLEQCLVA